MERPLSICHVVAPGPVGGLERVVQGLALGHHRQGHRVSVISVIGPDPEPHPFALPLLEAGVDVREVRLPSSAVLRERRAVREALRALSPDVVHSHGYRPDILHGSTARSLGIPTATTEHGSSKLGGTTAFFEWLQVKLFRFSQAVIAVSAPIARRLGSQGVPADRIHVIPNGWAGGAELLPRREARQELGIDPGATAVGFVGRFIDAKGPDVFVDALLRLREPDLVAGMIGDGTLLEELRARVASAGREADFRFAGFRANAAPLFSAFDLFVLSSRTEGTPIVLFEAIAAGVPVVVTRVGGVPDVVGEEEAILVPPEDPGALALAVQSCLDDPAAARARAERASQRLASHFGAETWLQRHETVYREISR